MFSHFFLFSLASFLARSLHELLENLAELHGGACFGKGVEFILDLAPDIPRMVVGSPMLLRQALTNLITNAIKFTSEGYVALSVELSSVVPAVGGAGGGSDSQQHASVVEPCCCVCESI
jgi:signal transduction histidine kinase